ncbi:ABC transporter permease [Kitasatospora kifunensis]|uniref:Multisubunit Na+/H+ antiporter MnhC subunit n=1 Tax=Kitasatospora kifunensis TaxID=58351 RepID=A0A7W7VY35_KITKI|nr:ABC transporter permease [Kitasatospora kifunensis]MBB4927136.1 multisubunit Na+/H+ antiporter MnhC subunit [Kitasatospora kifunensis]
MTRRPLSRLVTDLAIGLRLAFTGGRDSRLRTVLTAIGVGLGVATLLLAASFPSVREHRDDKLRTQSGAVVSAVIAPRSDHSLLIHDARGTFHGQDFFGRIVQPDGPNAPLPPGLSAYPAPGTLAVSPALAELLHSPGAALLRERYPEPITGTIGPAGLAGPGDYAFYLGSDKLTDTDPTTLRIDHFEDKLPPKPTDPVLLLLTVAGVVILLSPVAVFVAAATRFGGEARDRRLAALRLAGADRSTTARISAGESLAGALLGLGVGIVFFLIGRQLVSKVTVSGLSIFADDIQPQPMLAALVLVAVPLLAVAVTMLTMRRIAAEPLGVVRGAETRRRTIWWRVLLPLLGFGLLFTQRGKLSSVDDNRALAILIVSLLLLLVGATLLLPPLVALASRVLRRVSGPPAWQLALGRLRFNPETAARPVTGIVVTVAGAIALQSLLGSLATARSISPAELATMDRTLLSVSFDAAGDRATQLADQLRHSPGVADANGYTDLYASAGDQSFTIRVADCATLKAMNHVTDCTDGDVFTVLGLRSGQAGHSPLAAGGQVQLEPLGEPKSSWQLPASRATVEQSTGDGRPHYLDTILATPSVLPAAVLRSQSASVELHPLPGTPDAEERMRTDAVLISPESGVYNPSSKLPDAQFLGIRNALTAGTVAILTLIGAGMLVGLLEQLRERRRTLAVLTAFGTRTRTLACALLYQSALPVLLGLALALGSGLALGTALLFLAKVPIGFAWGDIALMSGAGAAAVLLVTALSLPVLWRRTKPAGLRYE